MLNTMRMAKDCGFRWVIFKGDNERVIHLLKEGGEEEITHIWET